MLSGHQKKCKTVDSNVDLKYVNELNSFYARFDIHNFKEECNTVLDIATDRHNERIEITHEDTIQSIKHIKHGKACGPDQINAKVLRNCTYMLAKPLQVLFQASVDQGTVPTIWKTSEIVPIPKTAFPKTNNDLRPIALDVSNYEMP